MRLLKALARRDCPDARLSLAGHLHEIAQSLVYWPIHVYTFYLRLTFDKQHNGMLGLPHSLKSDQSLRDALDMGTDYFPKASFMIFFRLFNSLVKFRHGY